MAPQDRLAAVEHLAPRVFAEVLEYDYEDCLVTDESDIFDFLPGSDDVKAALGRFEQHYFVDPRPLRSTRIVALLELLHTRAVTA